MDCRFVSLLTKTLAWNLRAGWFERWIMTIWNAELYFLVLSWKSSECGSSLVRSLYKGSPTRLSLVAADSSRLNKPLESFTMQTDYIHPDNYKSWAIVIINLRVVVETSWISLNSPNWWLELSTLFLDVHNRFWRSSWVSFSTVFHRLSFNSSNFFPYFILYYLFALHS